MSFLLIPVILFFLIGCVFYFTLQYTQRAVQWSIAQFIMLPKSYYSLIIPAFVRVLRLNWYTFLMLVLLWVLLFQTVIGKDIIENYLDTLIELSPFEKFGSYLSLFLTVFFMSISIWVLPFFLYSAGRKNEIKTNYLRFYLATKMLAFIAMLPFMVVTNAFFAHQRSPDESLLYLIPVNIILFLLFLLFVWVSRFDYFEKIFKRIYRPVSKRVSNYYVYILIRLFFWIILLTLLLCLISFANRPPLYYVSAFMFLSSIIVFRLLFYSNENGENVEENVSVLVNNMIGEQNRRHSKLLYLLLIIPLFGGVIYYYLVPSLIATSTLYVLLVVFSFYIIYLDFWRNIFKNGSPFWKVMAFFATMLFLVTPFITTHNQFRIGFVDMDKNVITSQITLEKALERRYVSIVQRNNNDSSVFIVCAMGGGSRAGYIAARVLQQFDELNSRLWERTICYSTISGGSVGLYNYFKAKEFEKNPLGNTFLSHIYQQNYNSSGVFGLFAGDAFETIFGGIITTPRSWLPGNTPSFGFHDRNQRIRNEYNYILHHAIYNTKSKKNYANKTYYPWINTKNYSVVDSFKTYFNRRPGIIPIHLINTFEINSGRRAVLSPFKIDTGSLFFLNALQPLQDTNYDSNIMYKDIKYRDAVNLSELFPLISAASHLGAKSNDQFVDGGYYENYGLATGIDVFYYLRDSMHIPAKYIKLLLIKNSKQEPKESKQNIQLIAPITGAMNSPFTGHANQFLKETERLFEPANVHILEFDAEFYNVPLTRSLNKRHIDAMNRFVDSFYLKEKDQFMQFLK